MSSHGSLVSFSKMLLVLPEKKTENTDQCSSAGFMNKNVDNSEQQWFVTDITPVHLVAVSTFSNQIGLKISINYEITHISGCYYIT